MVSMKVFNSFPSGIFNRKTTSKYLKLSQQLMDRFWGSLTLAPVLPLDFPVSKPGAIGADEANFSDGQELRDFLFLPLENF